jgi:ribose-phosphate pyrophosphokinase
MLLDLTYGVTETKYYKAWKFPGGEIHFKLKEEYMAELDKTAHDDFLDVVCRLNSSDDILMLGQALNALSKSWDDKVRVFIPYLPYQQADRNFGDGECFGLLTMVNILKSFERYSYTIFDPHSDVSPGLLAAIGKVSVIDNSDFIEHVLTEITEEKNHNMFDPDADKWNAEQGLVILSPDAGAYKKIFKLCEKIGFKGRIETANKYRDPESGEIKIRLSVDDFEGKDILIIDDICIGGATFVQLAKQLVKRNIANVHLAVSHGIFSSGFGELEKYFRNVFTTNSIKDHYDDELVGLYEII